MSKYKTKLNLILSHERKLARAVAYAAIKPARLSVWDVLIPFVFITGYLQQKEKREQCVQNCLYTKTLALDAALSMAGEVLTRTEALDRADAETRSVLASVSERIYSHTIREKQMVEIALLTDHYHRLLNATGVDYTSLVMTAYSDKNEFIRFLSALKRAEEEVAEAARQLLGSRTDNELRQRIEKFSGQIRHRWVDRIFT